MTFRLDWQRCHLDTNTFYQDAWVYLDADYVEEVHVSLLLLGHKPFKAGGLTIPRLMLCSPADGKEQNPNYQWCVNTTTINEFKRGG